MSILVLLTLSALHRLAGNDGISLVPALEEGLSGNQVETGLGLIPTVAPDAVLLEDSPHLASKELPAGSHFLRVTEFHRPGRVAESHQKKG